MNPTEAISRAQKRTPVKLWLRGAVDFPGCRVFPCGENTKVIFGEWSEISAVLRENSEKIEDFLVEYDRRNSALPLLDIRDIPARIEPGAVIRDGVRIGKNAVIMMGAILNVGAAVGENSMVDMGAVLGGRAQVGKNCHIGAGAVLAGVIEPPSAKPVVIEDGVLIGANAVVLEGCRVGRNAVVAAGAVVTADVPGNAVVAGSPARIVKFRDERTDAKTELVMALRSLEDQV